MKLLIATATVAVLLSPLPASATTVGFDLPFTNACFEAAAAKDRTGNGLQKCGRAIGHETTTLGSYRAANLVNRGILLLVANNDEAADRDFSEALSIDPTQAEAWLGKAIQAWHEGRSAEAAQLATRSLEYGPQRRAVAYFIRGLANEQQGAVSAAYSDLQMARQLEPSWSAPAEQLQRYRVVSH